MKQATLTSTEAVMDNMQTDGPSTGTGPGYKPRIRARNISSFGRIRRVWCDKTKRMYEFYSDAEYKLFLARGGDESPPAAG